MMNKFKAFVVEWWNLVMVAAIGLSVGFGLGRLAGDGASAGKAALILGVAFVNTAVIAVSLIFQIKWQRRAVDYRNQYRDMKMVSEVTTYAMLRRFSAFLECDVCRDRIDLHGGELQTGALLLEGGTLTIMCSSCSIDYEADRLLREATDG